MIFWAWWLLAWQLDPELRTQVLHALERLDRFCVTFEQETYSDFFDETLASGELCVSRPGRMKMTYTQGENKLIVCDGEHYIETDFQAETVTRLEQTEIMDEPLIRIFLYGAQIQDFFLIDRFEDESGATVFRFRPRDASPFVFEITFDPAWLPKAVHVYSEEGDGSRFTFGAFDLNPHFSEDFFSTERTLVDPL